MKWTSALFSAKKQTDGSFLYNPFRDDGFDQLEEKLQQL